MTYMLSISSSGSEHESGLTEGEADQPDEGPSFLQEGHDEEDGGENKDRVLCHHMEASQVWGGDQVTKFMFVLTWEVMFTLTLTFMLGW